MYWKLMSDSYNANHTKDETSYHARFQIHWDSKIHVVINCPPQERLSPLKGQISDTLR